MTKGCATVAESVIAATVHTLSLLVALKSKLCTSIMLREISGALLRNRLKMFYFISFMLFPSFFLPNQPFFQNGFFFVNKTYVKLAYFCIFKIPPLDIITLVKCIDVFNFSRQALLIFTKESSKTRKIDKNPFFSIHSSGIIHDLRLNKLGKSLYFDSNFNR